MKVRKYRNAVCRMSGLVLAVVLSAAAAGCVGTAESREENEIQVGENQRLATVIVKEITGNDLTVIEIDAEEENGNEMQFAGEIGSALKGEEGEYEIINNGEDGYPNEIMSEAAEAKSDGASQEGEIEAAGPEILLRIPVGITVHTSEGTVSGITGIKPGDWLQILFELYEDGSQAPAEIWIQ